jgi:DNA helicase II / ATP-dependent DNA helicase PcrA
MKELLDTLNVKQFEAVTCSSRHVLVLAGAGSGKTKTLTSRILYLINELGVHPGKILAVTFTNKAANEMKERVAGFTGRKVDVMIKTFHSFGAYILRHESQSAGRKNNFQIYDDDDSRKVILAVLKKFGYARSMANNLKRWIALFKQNLEDMSKMEFREQAYLDMYNSYNSVLNESNCFDFEDLILQPVKMFSKFPELASRYSSRFKYVLIDEYQDTNRVQYDLVNLLCSSGNNLMVVGDEDQSIYGFRGADVNIILDFNNDYEQSRVIRLEENYRSTSNILNTANNVIRNNKVRLGKNLFTKGEEGDKVVLFRAYNEYDEAEKIINFIFEKDLDYGRTAILYRTNIQSRAFESIFNSNKIPYVIVGSIAFYDREEIKDCISILKWAANPNDRIAFERFINKPARGIGDKTLQEFYKKAADFDNNLFVTLEYFNASKPFSKKVNDSFSFIWDVFKDKDVLIAEKPVSDYLYEFLERLGLLKYFKEVDEKEHSDKINNIDEFLFSIEELDKGMEELLAFLEDFTLTASSVKQDDDDSEKIKLMTVHNAKGLEFDNVFIAGVESGLFPHASSYEEDNIEEERRLFYVAITRARMRLFISYCEFRNIYGYENNRGPSEFIYELDDAYLEYKNFTSDDLNQLGFYRETVKPAKVAKIIFTKGDIVRHKDYGKGKILSIKEVNGKHLANIDFWDHSCMEVIVEYTKLEKVED